MEADSVGSRRRRGKPDAPLHHFVQGSQYISEQFQRLMAGSGIVCSTSRLGKRLGQLSDGKLLRVTQDWARKTYRARRLYNATRRHSTSAISALWTAVESPQTPLAGFMVLSAVVGARRPGAIPPTSRISSWIKALVPQRCARAEDDESRRHSIAWNDFGSIGFCSCSDCFRE